MTSKATRFGNLKISKKLDSLQSMISNLSLTLHFISSNLYQESFPTPNDFHKIKFMMMKLREPIDYVQNEVESLQTHKAYRTLI